MNDKELKKSDDPGRFIDLTDKPDWLDWLDPLVRPHIEEIIEQTSRQMIGLTDGAVPVEFIIEGVWKLAAALRAALAAQDQAPKQLLYILYQGDMGILSVRIDGYTIDKDLAEEWRNKVASFREPWFYPTGVIGELSEFTRKDLEELEC